MCTVLYRYQLREAGRERCFGGIVFVLDRIVLFIIFPQSLSAYNIVHLKVLKFVAYFFLCPVLVQQPAKSFQIHKIDKKCGER